LLDRKPVEIPAEFLGEKEGCVTFLVSPEMQLFLFLLYPVSLTSNFVN